MNKLSIIIPVYNLEKHIGKCLDSIIKQLPLDGSVQVYAIDDGSKDGSRSIIQSYEENNDYIHYVHKKNGGVSSARNLGLELIDSEYVTFVDGDDTVSDDYIEQILRYARNGFELLCFNAYRINGYEKSKVLKIDNCDISLKPHEGINGYLTGSLFYKLEGFVWNKAFRVDVIKDNNLRFDEDQRICEDLLFNSYYCDHINTIKFIDSCLYEYYIYDNSAIHGYNSLRSQEYMKFIDKYLKYSRVNNFELNISNLLSFYISWWFSVISDESYNPNFKDGKEKIHNYLNNGYFKSNLNKVKFSQLNTKRKIYYILIRLHLTNLVYLILYKRNK